MPYSYSPEGIRVKVLGNEYPRLMAWDSMMDEKNLLPSAVRLCVIYYLAFGTYPKIGQVSEKQMAATKGTFKHTVIKFEPDDKTNKFLRLLSNNGKLSFQLLMLAEKCIGVCEEGEEWGCTSADLQDILIVAHSKKEGLPYDESLLKAGAIGHKPKIKQADAAGNESTEEPAVKEQEPEVMPAQEDIREELLEIFRKSLALSTKSEMRSFAKSQKELDTAIAESWVEFIRRNDKKTNIEWKTGIIRMVAQQNDPNIW